MSAPLTVARAAELRVLAAVTLADVPAARCACCGCAFGELYPLHGNASLTARLNHKATCEPARVVTDWRFGDVLCARCTASRSWSPADWHAVNAAHYVGRTS